MSFYAENCAINLAFEYKTKQQYWKLIIGKSNMQVYVHVSVWLPWQQPWMECSVERGSRLREVAGWER